MESTSWAVTLGPSAGAGAAEVSCARWSPVLPVVFVHGLIGPLADTRTVSLLRPAPVVCPDLLGYGRDADADPAHITIDAQVEYALAAVDRATPGARVHLVGHSVGGVIATTFAHRFPERVASVINVEGNFTLADAFWSAQLARKAPGEVSDLLEAGRADPARWLRNSGVEPTDEHLRSASQALVFQPATTVQAMARAIVEFTGRPGYESQLREVFHRTPVHLIAGARSRAGWNVPEWALAEAASYTEIPDAGHLVMLEAPRAFGTVLMDLTRSQPS